MPGCGGGSGAAAASAKLTLACCGAAAFSRPSSGALAETPNDAGPRGEPAAALLPGAGLRVM